MSSEISCGIVSRFSPCACNCDVTSLGAGVLCRERGGELTIASRAISTDELYGGHPRAIVNIGFVECSFTVLWSSIGDLHEANPRARDGNTPPSRQKQTQRVLRFHERRLYSTADN
jgi:hypothetical protein